MVFGTDVGEWRLEKNKRAQIFRLLYKNEIESVRGIKYQIN